MFVSPHALTSRAVWHITEKGWSSDFPPLPSAFSSKWAMAFMLRSHNGVHCCGTVGDSHSSSQLIAAKRTFTGEGRGYASTFTLTLSRITMQRYNKEMKKVTFWGKKTEFVNYFIILRYFPYLKIGKIPLYFRIYPLQISRKMPYFAPWTRNKMSNSKV